MTISAKAKQQVQALLDYIDASPSPWHAVSHTAEILQDHGFTPLSESQSWDFNTEPHGKYYVVRDGGSIIAFVVGEQPIAERGFNIVGAHTDSPGLRLKPKAGTSAEGLNQLGVEVYGGPILATFTDRDLSLAGRVTVKTKTGFETQLVKLDESAVRLPNLAIHMNREVNTKGLLLNKQTQLPLIYGFAADSQAAQQALTKAFAKSIGVKADSILTWEIQVYDTQKGAFWGEEQAFYANSQLDNLASCHAALVSLLSVDKPKATCIAAFFDHEEVGSESATGAGGSFLLDVLNRICLATNATEEDKLRGYTNSFFISADMAHAYLPNHPSAYEPAHHVQVNSGPVIKVNANQRYTSNAETTARFIQLCEQADVPYQQYTHRTDLGCGSTIGPIMSAQLGMPTVDVGNPMWAMHSIRESAGVLDHGYMIEVMKAHFA